jgi:two-component system chemotaxis response regulator CheB
MIQVLVVEDSPVIREFLSYIFNDDSALQVIATARNGLEAIEAVDKYRPDVITMDINMPKMNGFEATRAIMEIMPTPIIIVSGSWANDEVATTFQALEAGALMVVARPTGIGHPDHETSARALVQAVKLMSEVKVVRRWPKTSKPQPATVAPPAPPAPPAPLLKGKSDFQIVAVGASTGGPLVLQTILSQLPADFPAPLLIVQHMAEGFIKGFADWLNQSSPLMVRIAANGEIMLPGNVYIAPDATQISVGVGGRLILNSDARENGHCPSISHCFRAVAQAYGKSAIGILLTGMGKDGAAELKLMRDCGAITIAQDEVSSVVFGMPAEAIRIGAAQHTLNPEQIVEYLKILANKTTC